jgi:transcriptional regulator with XRE-family HTH domain
MTQALTSRENLLRWWRTEQTDLSLEAVARLVAVSSPTTVHNWETGRTEGPSIAQLRAMDSRYGAGRALEGLYAAIRTPDALEPAREWWCNFQGPSGPC